ncbi:MAG: hypothetical protein A2X52_18135 [Candidatus Rokubacteria bacterium GWC2_70_16]|nr:MAG: hypothetical protein A2X52_18135 [Candidatus Rokubacteria bacterium GWC2_70_16]
MGTLGVLLREIRQSRGVSLDEMARATRVGKRQLEALEAEDLRELPAPVFVKGFIRAYCGFLQVAPDDALARYGDLLGHGSPAQGMTTGRSGGAAWRWGPVVVSFVLLVLLGGALLIVNMGFRARPDRAATAPARPAAQSDPAASLRPGPERAQSRPALPELAPVVPAGSVPPAPRGSQRLVVRAIEPTWIKVQMDGVGSVQELLPTGATREWSARERFVLTVGNAGGLQLELNGQALPSLGARGAVIRELVLPQSMAASGS